MVRDEQAILSRKSREAGMTVETAAARAGMSEKTGRRWLRRGLPPGEAGADAGRAEFRSAAVPLCPALLQLGDGQPVLGREL